MAMNCGPLRFQCACLVSNARSIASASRAFSRFIATDLAFELTSFFVMCIRILISSKRRPAAGSGAQRAILWNVPGQPPVFMWGHGEITGEGAPVAALLERG